MADSVDIAAPYNQFQQDQQANRRAALSAMATGGTAAKQQVEAAQNRIQSTKQQAVQRAALESQQFNAPAEAQSVISRQIADPYDLSTNSLAAGQANRAMDMDTRGTANDQYYGKLDALIPAYQAQAKTAYDTARARKDAENALQAQQLQQQANEAQARLGFERESLANNQAQQEWQHGFSERQFEAQQAQDARDYAEDVRRYGIAQAQKMAAARSGGGGGGRGSSGYGGTGTSKTDLKSQFPAMIQQIRGAFDPKGVTSSSLAKITGVDKLINNTASNTIGNQLGLSPVQVSPLMPKYDDGLHVGTPTNQSPDRLRQDPLYVAGVDILAGALAGDSQSLTDMGLSTDHTVTQAAIIAAFKASPAYQSNRILGDQILEDVLR